MKSNSSAGKYTIVWCSVSTTQPGQVAKHRRLVDTVIEKTRPNDGAFHIHSGAPRGRPSVVNVSQIVTVDKSFLTDRVGSLNKQSMKQVDAGLRLVLSV
jgi:mRNA-degrading endonuclease toxin of MazEF toxin-antitoxin module